MAICNQKIVGGIWGSVRYREFLEIDIEADKAYQQRGIVRQKTMRFCTDCMMHDIVPHWDCMKDYREESVWQNWLSITGILKPFLIL